MTIRLLALVALLLFPFAPLFAQSGKLQAASYLRLPGDSLSNLQLVASADSFLLGAQGPDSLNTHILPAEKLPTLLLLQHLKGITRNSALKIDTFYRPQLINLLLLEKDHYLLEITYLGMLNSAPILQATVQLAAYKVNDRFLFASPLSSKTRLWKTSDINGTLFHYSHAIDQVKAKEYSRYVTLYDKKLNAHHPPAAIYSTDNLPEALQLIGITYKAPYNGYAHSLLSVVSGQQKLIVDGHNEVFQDFDPHDLWHERLALVIARSLTNKPVDEGCAYLYGGSWGFGWKEIFAAFKQQLAVNKNMDWAACKDSLVYFKTGDYNNSADNIVNALFVRKIEKAKGFAGVWELLTCGPYEKGNEKYYQVLEKLTGITRDTYNARVWELIEAE